MLVVRPAGPQDFDALMELALLSGRGFTSLPADEGTLRRRLELSEGSFSGAVPPLDAAYTLMLEDARTGAVGGVAGVKGSVGVKRPFFSFRVVTLAQSSSIIGTRFDHQALVLVNECGGWSEVGSLFLRPEWRKGGAGRLLAQSRYMLIGTDTTRFAEMVLAELRGWFDQDGVAPFYECLASKFFRLPFDEADLMSASTDGQFIMDLAPRHPIYLELLPERVRRVVGEVHEDGRAALSMLRGEGFRYQGLIDIFDGGPTVACPRDDIRTVRENVGRRVRLAAEVEGPMALVSTDAVERFRAVRAPVALDEEHVVIPLAAAQALRVHQDDTVRVKL
jgi:arginine N-succinyltransferase